jgi:enamine deaminase RidA (YjgF/YER057c/UK114 family)
MRRVLVAALALGFTLAPLAARADNVTFTGDPTASIASGVLLAPGATTYLTSGIPPSAPFGDTKSQGENVLRKIEAQLQTQGMTLRNVVYLTVYLTPDASGKVDYQGWFDAYAEFFGTTANPTKPARATLAVAGLVNPAWRIEIAAIAAR